MALQPNSGPGLPLWGFITITFLQGWIVSPAPSPQPGGPIFYISLYKGFQDKEWQISVEMCALSSEIAHYWMKS
jgi:hypothetical protein